MRSVKAAALSVAALLSLGSAVAHDDGTELADLVTGAELIFEGVVTNVEYGQSESNGPEQPAFPHTFVTFQIDRVFKGSSSAGRSITLRFVGGPAPNGLTLIVPRIPTFDTGDRDVVFAKGNQARFCPVLGGFQGRFRVVDGNVFTDDGRELYVTRDRRLATGRFHPLPEVLTDDIAGRTFGIAVREEEEETAEPPAGATRLDRESFGALVGALVRERHTPQDLARIAPVPSAHSADRFTVPPMRAAAPPSEIVTAQHDVQDAE